MLENNFQNYKKLLSWNAVSKQTQFESSLLMLFNSVKIDNLRWLQLKTIFSTSANYIT